MLDALNAATNLKQIADVPGWKLEALKGNLKGKYSIRINDQYRIIFKFDAPNASNVEISKHYE